ncbi:hypothetical protein KDL44_09830 [bacterium]|nr:hypothetical protein [bacterium]
MSGTVIDPRTGEERRVIPAGIRISILLGIALVAGWLLYTKVFGSSEYALLRDTAYMHTGFIKYAQEDFQASHGRYATLAELRDSGLIDYEIVNEEARIGDGITARCELPLDRQNYRLTVSFLRGSYMTTADDEHAFADVPRPH